MTCHRSDCIFIHPVGRDVSEARHGCDPPSSSLGPRRVEPPSTPIDYGKFDDILGDDLIDDLLTLSSGWTAPGWLHEAIGQPPLPDSSSRRPQSRTSATTSASQLCHHRLVPGHPRGAPLL
eukprot:8232277-Pyramimonas_sp.AAC.1